MNLTLKLQRQVKTADGTTTAELTLRELTVAENVALERKGMGKGTLEQDVEFFAMSCGVSPDVVMAMGQRDWTRLKNLYYSTLGNVGLESENSE